MNSVELDWSQKYQYQPVCVCVCVDE
jgi:hypothetical protein